MYLQTQEYKKSLTQMKTCVSKNFEGHAWSPSNSHKPHVGIKKNKLEVLSLSQCCQFRSVLPEIIETFHTNSKNETKQNNFHFILNLDPFRIFQLNFSRNVLISFHMFRSGLEKPLNQIEHGSI